MKDMEASLQFYHGLLGLPIDHKLGDNKQVSITFLGDGDTKMELIQDASRPGGNVGKDISWGLRVDSLDETYEKMEKAGVKILTKFIQPTPYIRFFLVQDPNGFTLQFSQELHPNK